jgi:hypothetical protein
MFGVSGQLPVSPQIGKVRPCTNMDGFGVNHDLPLACVSYSRRMTMNRFD